jgi:adenylate cyclase
MFYAAAAWLLVQVATQVFPFFGIPDETVRIAVIAVLIGFPFAMLFSWFYEWTPQGIKLESEIDRNESVTRQTGKTMDRWIIAVLALAVVLLLTDRLLTPSRTAATADRSIAVLPFASFSADAENGYFSDGLSEEILNSLARIEGMRVVGRTSSFQFKGKDEDLREVGRKLDVAHLLEGSVRRDGDRVRITAQLIRAADGIHLWSSTYDRRLNDVLAVQFDIAEQVAGALNIVMDETQRARMAQDGVSSVDAFIAYQKGLKRYDEAHDPERSRNAIDSLSQANLEFDKATALEPGFAQAYFMAADRYNHILLADDRPQAERLDAQQQAMRLYGLVAEHSHDPQQRLLALVERQMLSDDWHGLAGQIEAALKQPGCRNPDWLPVFASAFGYTALIEDLGRRTSACDPLNRINYNSRIRAALAAGQGQQALDIVADYEQSRGGVPIRNAARTRALIMLGRIDDARAALATITPHDEGRYTAEVMFGAITGENAAQLRARLQSIDRSQSIYQFWGDADAVAAAVLGDRAEANRRAAIVDAQPAGPFLLAVLGADCLCGAPFDLDATPNFKARLAESGLRWPPPPAIRYPATARTASP